MIEHTEYPAPKEHISPFSPGSRSLWRLNANIDPALAKLPNFSIGSGAKDVSKSVDPFILETIKAFRIFILWDYSCNTTITKNKMYISFCIIYKRCRNLRIDY